ncbi:MAG: FtsX-like permease family protein, partial [Chloroflexi bacterium]|nr:FtsX-like permease family protein [Chloroflexota bacterium]
MAAINQIALMQRVEELGTLNALGFDRRVLSRRLVGETAVITLFGWLIGVLFSLAFLILLRDKVLYAQGVDLNVWNSAPIFFVIPIPLAVIIAASISVRRLFNRLDAVQILERGKLSAESEKPRLAASRSTAKPLSSLTFYRRHRRRTTILVVTMALMILGVAFPAFLTLTAVNAMKPEIETWRHMSQIYPVQGQTIDPSLVAQIRSHPDVEQIVPVISLGMQMSVPPGGATSISLHGVSEQDMALLIDRFGVHLLEGHLPRPRSNDLIISESVAKNRGLAIGDTVGGASDDDSNPLTNDNIPTEMVIVGILGPDVPWVGLASYEFLQSHELTRDRAQRLLILPYAGREQELNSWLEQNAVTTLTDVTVYEAEVRQYEEMTIGISTAFALVESLIAIVAAVALATLNYIFYNQRREEFGILHAIGRSQLWLVLRTLRETSSTVFIAWLIGAVISVLGL